MSLTAPAHHLARGRLMRAIVGLPAHLCPKGEPLHERIVFFDAPRVNPGDYLQTLLSHAWHTNVSAWPCDSFYNVQAASALVEEGVSDNVDARLFEVGWGGPEGVTFADPARVELFVSPVLKARLQAVLDGLHGAGVERLRPPAEPALAEAERTAPEAIWLDLGAEEALNARFSSLHEVTWSDDNATGIGIKYIRADLAARAQAPAAEYPPLPHPAWGAKTIGTTEDAFSAQQMRDHFDLGRAARTTEAEPAPEVAA